MSKKDVLENENLSLFCRNQSSKSHLNLFKILIKKTRSKFKEVFVFVFAKAHFKARLFPFVAKCIEVLIELIMFPILA